MKFEELASENGKDASKERELIEILASMQKAENVIYEYFHARIKENGDVRDGTVSKGVVWSVMDYVGEYSEKVNDLISYAILFLAEN